MRVSWAGTDTVCASGWAVLQYNGMVQEPKIFSDIEYVNMPCVFGFYIESLELLWWNTGGSICFT